MGPVLRVLSVRIVACFALATSPVVADTAAVLAGSPASEAAVRFFTNHTDLPVVRRHSPNARDLDRLILEARAEWNDDLVVIIDAERAVVSVVRPWDGTIGSRALSRTAANAPYAVALAAVELLEIVRNAPGARSAALPEPRPDRIISRLSLDVGVLQTVSFNGDIGLLQPTAGADLELTQPRSSVWLAAGLHGAGLVPMQRDQVLLLPSGPDDGGSVEYARTELATRFSVGHRQGLAGAVGSVDLGLAFIRATARDGAGHQVAADERTAFWLGISGELRYSLGEGFALGIGGGAAWFPVTTRFYASPEEGPTDVPSFSEGPAELRAHLTLAWGAEL